MFNAKKLIIENQKKKYSLLIINIIISKIINRLIQKYLMKKDEKKKIERFNQIIIKNIII